MSDRSQDTAYSIPSVTEDLTKAMNVEGVSGRSFFQISKLNGD